MDPKDWAALNLELEELLRLDPPARENRLIEIDRGDAEKARQLRSLLNRLSQSESIDHLGESEIYQDAVATLGGIGPGTQLGDWTLIKRIGQGGMAEVFEAQREIGDGSQRAALKLMALGLASEEQRRRFKQETAILARLEDHRLSRLIDAGTASDGRPWLAMEHVNGVAIDQACTNQNLSIRERVGLMVEVANAVDRTHRQLVVHRDLKPDNVLVTAEGEVKLLDFGIATIRDPSDEDANITRTHTRAFTLRFASPEQLAGRHTGIDCDIYQLGLILYLLLTGNRAFEGSDDDVATLTSAMQGGPIIPSQRLATDPAQSSGERQRRARLVRGDLDSIVMQALEQEPANRYPGARELADDLQRWLDGEPVSARQYSRTYRALRYLRRHWVGAAAAGAIGALLLGYLVTLTYQSARLTEQRNQAEQARGRAEAIQRFLLEVFGSVDPEAQESRGKSVDQLLTEGAQRAVSEFEQQPLLGAQLLIDMGGVMDRRGRLEDAEGAYQHALTIRKAELGADHPQTLRALAALGDVYYRLGQHAQSQSLLADHLLRTEAVFGAPSDELIEALRLMGPVESVHGDPATAEDFLRRAIQMHGELHGDAPWTLARTDEVAETRAQLEHQLAVILLRQSRYEEAEPLFIEAAELLRSRYGDMDQRVLEVRKNLAFAMRMLRQPQEAERQFKEILALERDLYEGAHWQIAYSLGHLANLASDAKDYERAIALWTEAEQEGRRAVGNDHPWVLNARIALGRCMILGGQQDEGRALLQEIVALGDDKPAVAKRAQMFLDRYPATQGISDPPSD